jgi:hypothetical protein
VRGTSRRPDARATGASGLDVGKRLGKCPRQENLRGRRQKKAEKSMLS